MPRSFPDSGVRIDAARVARPERAQTALYYPDDPQRTCLTSPFVHLETVRKADYMGRSQELDFHEALFRKSGGTPSPGTGRRCPAGGYAALSDLTTETLTR